MSEQYKKQKKEFLKQFVGYIDSGRARGMSHVIVFYNTITKMFDYTLVEKDCYVNENLKHKCEHLMQNKNVRIIAILNTNLSGEMQVNEKSPWFI